MPKHWIARLFFVLLNVGSYNTVSAQSCSAVQILDPIQTAQLQNLFGSLSIALTNEELDQITSIHAQALVILGDQAGLPEALENYVSITADTSTLSLENRILLSRQLIAADSLAYAELWKLGKGWAPPTYQPHSLPLRAAGLFAAGFLKIANAETDPNRAELYTNWAVATLDTLLLMQLPSGAFPFPDLRPYNDPVFSSQIQNFLLQAGEDSLNVLQNGWIVDDLGSGSFKFDAGVLANAYFEAFLLTGFERYRTAVLEISDYLISLPFNTNYNYNTFVSLGLTRGYQLSGNTAYRDRAIKNIRYGVLPGQLETGNWMDGHNARSVYHNLMIENILPTLDIIPLMTEDFPAIRMLIEKAVDYAMFRLDSCNASTGFKWLLRSNQALFQTGTLESILQQRSWENRFINQANLNGRFLDISTMGMMLWQTPQSVGLASLRGNEPPAFPGILGKGDRLSLGSDNHPTGILRVYDLSGKLLVETGETAHWDALLPREGIYVAQIANSQITRGFRFFYRP